MSRELTALNWRLPNPTMQWTRNIFRVVRIMPGPHNKSTTTIATATSMTTTENICTHTLMPPIMALSLKLSQEWTTLNEKISRASNVVPEDSVKSETEKLNTETFTQNLQCDPNHAKATTRPRRRQHHHHHDHARRSAHSHPSAPQHAPVHKIFPRVDNARSDGSVKLETDLTQDVPVHEIVPGVDNARFDDSVKLEADSSASHDSHVDEIVNSPTNEIVPSGC